MRFRSVAVAACLIAPVVAKAHETRTFTLPDGTSLQYVLVLPDGFDPTQKYEGLLAFPGGDQTISRAVVHSSPTICVATTSTFARAIWFSLIL